jgi:hypothetical protein
MRCYPSLKGLAVETLFNPTISMHVDCGNGLRPVSQVVGGRAAGAAKSSLQIEH